MLALGTTITIYIRRYRAKKRRQGQIRPQYVQHNDGSRRPTVVQSPPRPNDEIVEIQENPEQGFVEVNLVSLQEIGSRNELNATNQQVIPSNVPSITFD